MLNAFKNNKTTSNASARVVDGKLILSFPDAVTPVVWQMDLTQTKASALEVQHNKEGNIFTLVLKTPKGETVEVAPFDNREFAVEGLMAASNALENAYGNIRNLPAEGTAAQPSAMTYAPRPASKTGTGKKWLISLAAVIGIVLLFNLWGSLMPRVPAVQSQNMAKETALQSVAPQNRTGVAVSADDFLNAQ